MSDWQGPEPDAHGDCVRASEAEAALAERDERIKEREAEREAWRMTAENRLRRIKELEAELAASRLREDRIPDRAVRQIGAADALADAVKNGLRPEDARRFVKDDPTLTMLAAEAAYRRA